ncbi:hypothetical protein [Herbaspirillum frisingense]|uniref:Uncharacterized protein n=1 Tax=Herbaspirillum frisingense TaxID=92645 RepID=A0ABU1PD63_9BURK|nr:hypothetical protein [Herbaspirillum frisingense]MDR6583789.1 hypothetical protein [Herbaspirillum frisingense]
MSLFHLAPESEARFRAVTNKTLHVSHVRHKCGCGKQTTAKALTQYGHCVSCQKAAEKQARKIVFITSASDRLLPDNSDRRFLAFPCTWTKARKA